MFATILLCGLIIFALFYVIDVEEAALAIQNFKAKKPHGSASKNCVIGNVFNLNVGPDKIFRKLRKWAKKYYPIYSIRLFYVNTINFLIPEDCELVLNNSKHNEKSRLYYMVHNWLGTGLLTSKGEKWVTRRKILTPAFHFSILQQFLIIFNREAEQLIETLKKECHKSSIINVSSHAAQYTLNTIAETAMGTKLNSDNAKHITYRKAVFDIGEIYIYRLIHPWLILPFNNYFRLGYYKEWQTINVLHKFTKEVITEREKTFEDFVLPNEEDEVYKGKQRLALLDLLLSAKKEGTIDADGIREEVDTFMFEGHDTTGAALGFALMLIACNKNVQDRLVEEINEVLDNPHQKPLYKHLQNMQYLERTIKEVLRLYPSVHFISRKLGEDLVTTTGYYLTKGSYVNIHIYDLHHNPEIYPDPEKFDPDRFLPENSKNRHPFAYLPFSAGPRNCIGQKYAMLELKAALCGILANFVLEPVDTPDTIVIVVAPILKTKDKIRVKFLPRVD